MPVIRVPFCGGAIECGTHIVVVRQAMSNVQTRRSGMYVLEEEMRRIYK